MYDTKLQIKKGRGDLNFGREKVNMISIAVKRLGYVYCQKER